MSEPTNARTEVCAAAVKGAVEEEDGVDGAHLGVDRDRLGPRCGGGDECHSAGTGSGETDCLDARVGDERDTEFGAVSVEQREGACGKARGGDGVGYRAPDELGGSWVGVVCLDDDGAACGQSRCGVTACDREGQREVACAEDGDGAKRDRPLTNVGPGQRSPVGQRRVDAGAVPAALAKDAGKEAKLSGGAADLTGQPRLRQSAFGDGALDDRVLDGLDIGGDRLDELGALLGGRRSVIGEGRGGGRAGGVHVGSVAIRVGGLELLACGGVEGADRLTGSPHGFAGYQHLSRQVSVGHRRSHVLLGLERSQLIVCRVMSGTNGRSDINACPRPFEA